MKNTPINIIGYGNWGSRLAKKLEYEGLLISSIVTDQEIADLNFETKYSRKEINLINWELPTFITTGPIHHHSILKYAKNKVFVEKPFYILGQSPKKYSIKPYVNYQWLNSSKLKCIKNFIGKDWEKLEIEMMTTTNIKRNFSIIEDFMPHIISILFNNPNDILRIKNSKKINKTIFEFELEVNKKNIFIKLGIGEKRITKFKTKNILIISDDPYYIYMNQEKINHKIDPISESVMRYLNYFANDECENLFVSNDFHERILNISRLLLESIN